MNKTATSLTVHVWLSSFNDKTLQNNVSVYFRFIWLIYHVQVYKEELTERRERLKLRVMAVKMAVAIEVIVIEVIEIEEVEIEVVVAVLVVVVVVVVVSSSSQ